MDLVARHAGLATFLFFTLISCAEQQRTTISGPTQGLHGNQLQLLSAHNITIQDEAGNAIPSATILVGLEENVPFAGNVLTTDANGVAAIPAEWSTALPLTVQAAGYITTTVPNAQPGDQSLKIKKQESAAEIEVRGTATDFGRLVTDGKVDFALMIPALHRENLLAFDLSTVISPKVDTIEIIGNEINLPSNISLPRQTENYIFPIEFNKPDYRAFFRNTGEQVLTATHGQFPLQRVIGDIRSGKSMFELINHFTFIEGGQKKMDIQGDLSGQDIAVNQTPFNAQVNVKAPAFATGLQMVSLGLVEQNGNLVPTDLKRLNANQSMNLKSFNNGGLASVFSFLVEAASMTPAVLNQPFSWFKGLLPKDEPISTTAIGAQDFTRLSFAFLPAQNGVTPQFLPLIAKPALNGNLLTLDTPALPAGMTAVATYLVMNEVETITTGDVVSERRSRLWEVWSPDWLKEVELPKIAFNKRPDRTYRWEVMFMARPSNFIGARGTASSVELETITHVTRNALDL